jgi:threonine/homoserine/homoserine lactone efflux protein
MSLVAVPSNSPKLHTGCGYVVVITLIACVLLVVNSFLVYAALGAYQEFAPAEMSEPRAQQAMQIVMPVLLIFLEYWLYDRFIDRVRVREVDQS